MTHDERLRTVGRELAKHGESGLSGKELLEAVRGLLFSSDKTESEQAIIYGSLIDVISGAQFNLAHKGCDCCYAMDCDNAHSLFDNSEE